jgi:hypothetical protein
MPAVVGIARLLFAKELGFDRLARHGCDTRRTTPP